MQWRLSGIFKVQLWFFSSVRVPRCLRFFAFRCSRLPPIWLRKVHSHHDARHLALKRPKKTVKTRMMSILKTLLSGHGARLVCQRCILDSLKLSSSGRVSVPGFGHSIRTISTNGRSIVREKQSSYFRKPSFGPLPPTERTNPSQQRVRTFSSTPTTRSNVDLEKVIGEITDLYGEAKDELEYAVEARGTTYYNDDKAAAAEVCLFFCLARQLAPVDPSFSWHANPLLILFFSFSRQLTKSSPPITLRSPVYPSLRKRIWREGSDSRCWNSRRSLMNSPRTTSRAMITKEK